MQSALQLAVQQLTSGKLPDAEATCRKILKAVPGQPDALQLLGALALQAGKYEKAIELIERAVRKTPNNPACHVNIGEAHRALGRLDQATSSFERALALDPRSPEAHCGMGSTLQAEGKTVEALASFDRALEANPSLAQAHYNRGNLLSGMGDADAAIDAYRRAIGLNPAFGDALYNLGNLLATADDHQAAADAFERAIASNPNFPNALYNLGNARRRLGQRDAAKAAYQRAVALDGTLVDAHMRLGAIALDEQHFAAAVSSFDRSLALDPDHALAHSSKGRALEQLGRFDEAVAAQRRAIELDPDLLPAHMGLSSALARVDRLEEANAAALAVVDCRRALDIPFVGEPIGRVLVLGGVEYGHFILNSAGGTNINVGMNNVKEHFEHIGFAQTVFMVDGMEQGFDFEDLPPCDLIFNSVSDPDAMPRCHEIVQKLVHGASVPVINPPDGISLTYRHKNYEVLRDVDGVVFPKTLRMETPVHGIDALTALIDDAGLGFPVLARCAGTHTGESLEKLDKPDQLDAYFDRYPTGPFYVSEFVDFSADGRNYIKMRCYVVDGVVHPSHMYIFDHWQVSQAVQVKDLMWANAWMIDEAKQFLGDPERYLGSDGFAALQAACDRLPLDYFGVDFARLGDGGILIFEANPVMRLPPVANDPFDFRGPYTEAIERSLKQMFLQRIQAST